MKTNKSFTELAKHFTDEAPVPKYAGSCEVAVNQELSIPGCCDYTGVESKSKRIQGYYSFESPLKGFIVLRT